MSHDGFLRSGAWKGALSCPYCARFSSDGHAPHCTISELQARAEKAEAERDMERALRQDAALRLEECARQHAAAVKERDEARAEVARLREAIWTEVRMKGGRAVLLHDPVETWNRLSAALAATDKGGSNGKA